MNVTCGGDSYAPAGAGLRLGFMYLGFSEYASPPAKLQMPLRGNWLVLYTSIIAVFGVCMNKKQIQMLQ